MKIFTSNSILNDGLIRVANNSKYMELAQNIVTAQKNNTQDSNIEQFIRELQEMVNNSAQQNGYSLTPFFHGTDANFTIFKVPAIFTVEKEYAVSTGEYLAGKGKGRLVAVYLKVKKPKPLDVAGIQQAMYKKQAVQDAIDEGFDSFIGREASDGGYGSGDQIVIFQPSQAKSAAPITFDNSNIIIPLEQRFNSSNNDIRY